MQEKYQWLKNPDTVTKIAAAVLLIALFCGIQCFAEDFFTNTFITRLLILIILKNAE